MTQYLWESSRIVYEGHWKPFVTYCRNKGLNVFNVRSRHFNSYCLDLFDDGFQPGTIISHRTSIASVLHHWKYDPANDPLIALLLRSSRIARPVEHRTMTEWDLHVVLSTLLNPPFADDDPDVSSTNSGIRLKWRTLKALFLLAFASARRRSFLHTLSVAPHQCIFTRGDVPDQKLLKLLPEAGFLVKNQLPSQAPSFITIPGIAHLNTQEPERQLCPVRQVGLYIRDTREIRGASVAVCPLGREYHQYLASAR